MEFLTDASALPGSVSNYERKGAFSRRFVDSCISGYNLHTTHIAAVYTTSIIVQDEAPVIPATISSNANTGIREGITVSHLPSPAPSPGLQGASGASSTSPLIVDKAAKGRIGGGSVKHSTPVVENPGGAVMLPPTSGRPAVVEDTLSDIEEAISEISSRNKIIKNHNQRHVQAPTQFPELPQEITDSGSEYSREIEQVESDSEDDDATLPLGYRLPEVTYTVDEVSRWTPTTVANYLRSRGVSQTTCDRFEEQEVTGTILIQLKMSDLKELDLGSFGKRFEVWKEIESFLENLQTMPNSSSARLSISSKQSFPRPRSSTVTAGILPRIKSQHDRLASCQNTPKQKTNVQGANALISYPPGTAQTFITESPISTMFEQPRSPPESPTRAQNSSSRDLSLLLSSYPTSFGLRSFSGAGTTVGDTIGSIPHHRDNSFDRNWRLSSAIHYNRPSTSAGSPTHKTKTSSGTTDSIFTGDSGFGGSSSNTPMVTEQSYFSAAESSTSRGRKDLRRGRASLGNDHRKTSYTEEQRVRTGTALSRHSRIGSSDTVRDESSLGLAPPIKDRGRPKSNSFSDSGSYTFEYPRFSSSSQTPLVNIRGVSDQLHPVQLPIVTRPTSEKVIARGPDAISSPTLSSPTTVSPVSIDNSQNDFHTKSGLSITIEDGVKVTKDKCRVASDGPVYRAATSQSELRKKSKKQNTSAWQEGLRNITPLEAAKEADFSGWMWKRGSGNVPTWGVRFFVLNGRRLSYFYAGDDTKERGLIDITSHKVLPATGDRIVNLHASLAAVTKTSTNPASTATSPEFFRGFELPNSTGETPFRKSPSGLSSSLSPTDGQDREKEKEPKERGWFTFKLVPPAPGAARGVTFTAPKLHYFATNTRDTGRAWMAAIMKATIEIDSTQPVTTSYSSSTISLAKARALRARPPDLAIIKAPSPGTAEFIAAAQSKKGLAISGINIDHSENTHDNGDADVEENDGDLSRSESRAGSHISSSTKGTSSDIKIVSEPLGVPNTKVGFLGMSGAGDVRSLGSGSLRSPSLEKLLSGEEVAALNEEGGPEKKS